MKAKKCKTKFEVSDTVIRYFVRGANRVRDPFVIADDFMTGYDTNGREPKPVPIVVYAWGEEVLRTTGLPKPGEHPVYNYVG